MKITICGSIKFAKELTKIYYQLEKLKHEPIMHTDMFGLADGTAKELINDVNIDHGKTKKKYNFIKIWHDLIVSGDAILVCNFTLFPSGSDATNVAHTNDERCANNILQCNNAHFTRKGIENYIGGNTLMEMGFAYVNDKKIFLLNPLPQDVPYLDEIRAMEPVIINGNLKKIKT